MSAPAAALTVEGVRALLEAVRDPEIPALTIADLGVLREVRVEHGRVTVAITPTYSGCPAMHAIADDIRRVLGAAGCGEVALETRLAPAWSSDWLSADARAKLREVGIAPPLARARPCATRGSGVQCPRCASAATECVSEFGSTACKALYRCRDCLEPFDYFKCL